MSEVTVWENSEPRDDRRVSPPVITSSRGVQVNFSQTYVVNTTFPLGYERRNIDGHIRITAPTSTRAPTYKEFLLSTHGPPLDAQSRCCHNELYLHYCCLLLKLPASGRVFNILFRIPVLYPYGYIRWKWNRRLSFATRQISK